MLKGLDISHHNKNFKDVNVLNNYDFIIMKATEGANYKDSALSYFMKFLRKDMLKGFYHYARPELKNTPEMEASNFVSIILKYMDGRCIVALDVEGAALNLNKQYLDHWCCKWCEYVYNATGIKPMIYTSEAYTSFYHECVDFGCGLWCAKWATRKPTKIKPWEFFAIWQKSSKEIVSSVRCDLDYFNGTKEQYLKYCGVK